MSFLRTGNQTSRVLVAAVGISMMVLTSGCSWFGKRGNGYAQTPRPLEVPPDLAATTIATGNGSVMASDTASNMASFQIGGTRDEVFAKVGQALSTIDGVKINSQAQALGLFDVAVAGANVLIRITEQNGQSTVSAVDARGQSTSSETVAALLQQIRTGIAK